MTSVSNATYFRSSHLRIVESYSSKYKNEVFASSQNAGAIHASTKFLLIGCLRVDPATGAPRIYTMSKRACEEANGVAIDNGAHAFDEFILSLVAVNEEVVEVV